MSYIKNTDGVVVVKRKPRELDGFDGLLGVSVGLFNILQANVDFGIQSSVWYYGMRLHIPILVTNGKIKLDFGK